MKKNLQKGFTLIELLVVIAIIGILASVVLASLNSARGKAADSAIKADLNSVRAQAELYFDSNSNSYGTLAAGACPGVTNTTVSTTSMFYDSNIKSGIQHAGLQAGAAAGTGSTATTPKTSCQSNGVSWAAAVVLKTSATSAWCVDSNGASKAVTITADTPSGAYAVTSGVVACK